MSLEAEMKKDVKKYLNLPDGARIPDEETDPDPKDQETPLSRIWSDWNDATAYMDNVNAEKGVEIYENYSEGRQRDYMPKSLPNVILPVIPAIIRQKTSTICENPVRIEFFSNVSTSSSEQMTRFSDYQLDLCHFKRHLKSCVRYSLIEGTSFLHIFWNEDSVGREAIAQGGIKMERIPLIRVRVANKDVKDLQDQEWVMVASRESVKKVREMCVKNEDKDKVQSDANEFDPSNVENGGQLCTVITRYFRKDGEVYFEKACKATMLCDPKPMNPEIMLQMIKMAKLANSEKMDAQTSTAPDDTLDRPTEDDTRMKFNLYPLAKLIMTESSDSYLGISDVDDMISGQNCINVMYALAVQNGIDIQTKYRVKDDALGNQTLSGKPGEIITDHHRGTDPGISILAGTPSMTNEMLNLPLTLIETVKKLKAASDITMGDVQKEYSATAISLLQTAAEKPTEDMIDQKEQFVEDVGRICLLFYKFYYEDARYMFKMPLHQRKTFSTEKGIPLDSVPERVEGRFWGQNYQQDIFDIKVSVGPGGKMSQATQYQFLVQFFQIAPNMKPSEKRMFIKATPSYILNDKQELLDLIDEEESGESARKDSIIAQMQAALDQYAAGSKQMGTIINYLKNYIKEYQNQSGALLNEKTQMLNTLIGQQPSAQGTPKARTANAASPKQGSSASAPASQS